MTEPLLEIPAGGWTVDDLDAFPESNRRYELTDGALTVSPSPSSLHQAFAARLLVHLEAGAPEPLAVTQGVEIRFGRQLTRIPDVLVVRSPQPERHWFAPSEVLVAVEIESPGSHLEDRATKPALYAKYGIPHYWRIELRPPLVSVYGVGQGDCYQLIGAGPRLSVSEPFACDVAIAELLPRWAGRGEGPTVPEQGL
ncbi:MAG: Uma2 family endonuclease [Actinomycetota bacterium]|nr:Uma2 family endonuclease [Actinomycetota bacterium]MDQ3901428.1 Uma2 family endonuclease [Actinomycetota bacterium]